MAFDLELQKEAAKIGMSATLGASVISSLFIKKSKAAKNIHIASSVAFCGFTLWHVMLYEPKKNKKQKTLKKSTILTET